MRMMGKEEARSIHRAKVDHEKDKQHALNKSHMLSHAKRLRDIEWGNVTREDEDERFRRHQQFFITFGKRVDCNESKHNKSETERNT